jgi:PAS domain-containing protein
MSLTTELTPIIIATIGGLTTVGGAYLAIVPQLKKSGAQTREMLANSTDQVTEHVKTVDTTLKNGLRDAMLRLESMVADVHATQKVTAQLDDRPIFRTTPHGGLVWANEAAQRLLGMNLADMQEDGWAKAVHPDDAKLVFMRWKQSVQDRSPYGPQTYRYLNPQTGLVTWVKAVAQPIINRNLNQLEGWVATVVVVDDPTKKE